MSLPARVPPVSPQGLANGERDSGPGTSAPQGIPYVAAMTLYAAERDSGETAEGSTPATKGNYLRASLGPRLALVAIRCVSGDPQFSIDFVQ